jgi:hypothetical protein
MNIIRYLLAGWIGLLLCPVTWAASKVDDFPIPVASFAGSHSPIKSWLILGPFQAKIGASALDTDFLATLGVPEIGLQAGTFSDLVRRAHATGSELGRVYRPPVQDYVDFKNLFKKDISAGEGEGAVYAACLIPCDADRELWLLAASDDSIKVWLNGQRVHASNERRPLHLYDDVVRLPLKKGQNLLVIKVGNVSGGWELAASLEPSLGDALRCVLKEDGLILENPVHNRAAPLALRLRGIPPELSLEARISPRGAASPHTIRIGDKRMDLPTGLYRLELYLRDQDLGSTTCLVDPDGLLPLFRRRAAPFLGDERCAINIGALVRRWEILLRPDNKKTGDKDWQEKMVYTATELDEILGRLESHEEPFSGVSGLHIRGFRSQIDDQVQHYRVFAPANHQSSGASLPLIVMLPTPVSTSRPFIESPFIANHNDAVALGKIATELGAMILWSGYRNTPYGNPCEFTHFEESLAAVMRDYRIDATRISLVGACGAGIPAAMSAVMNPKRFSAIGLVNPVLNRLKNRLDDSGEYQDVRAYRAWLQECDPVERLAALGALPIWIIHDSVDPDHGPLAQSVNFHGIARSYDHAPRFELVKDLFSRRTQMWRKLFTWLVEQRREPSNTSAAGIPRSSRKGPISTVFSERFVVVMGSGGDLDEQSAMPHLSKAVQDGWRATQHGDCRVILDTALSADDECTSNLVLLGNAATNLVWSRLASRLPIKLGRDSVELDGQSYKGTDLSVQSLAIHPDHPQRKLVLIGSAKLAEEAFGTQELSVDGWFNYAVWEKVDGRPRLVAAE